MAFIILPIHLFSFDILLQHIKDNIKDNIKHFYLIEEPIYFGDHQTKLNFNKLKLIYHRATMQHYYNTYKKQIQSIAPIKYIEYHKLQDKNGYNEIKDYDTVYLFDPVDNYLDSKYSSIFNKKLQPYLESPLFLTSREQLKQYNTKHSKSYFHASFYKWQRERPDIKKVITEINKTYDTENRHMMPLDTQTPKIPQYNITTTIKKILTEAITYINKYFPDNLEPIYVQNKSKTITPDSILFPITHKTTYDWFINFCKHRFHLFGKYEDAIDSVHRNILFHSAITPMLNIGLITPFEILNLITKFYNENKKTIHIANYEGFIRQILGWREYQRYIYCYIGEKMRSSNHFSNDRKLTKHWYNATTDIKPVDDAITLALNDGYIHHILRLMVIGNIMNLVGIHPHEVYKWFMEFSLDSYDWVMVGNVYSMTLWADGGLTMRKPYISSDNYIMKMSNYPKGEKWNEKWKSLFYHFIDRNREKLKKTYYAGLIRTYSKTELATANQIISTITNK